MPYYRYYTADLLTGNVLGDLELYGVYMTKQLSRAGMFNGTTKLQDISVSDAAVLGATTPARTALYVERDNELIWGGILWSRTYSDQSQAIQLSAQTFESYFDHVVLETHVIQQKVNQEIIFQNVVNQLQSQQGCNLGFAMATLPTTNTPRTVLIPAYEYHFATDAINQLVGVDGGLEYTIDVTASATPDQPAKTIRLGYPELGAPNAALAFDFPGTIAHYWMPESGASAGVKFAVLGAGSGNKVIRATAVDLNALNAGYPGWWHVEKFSHIGDLNIAQSKVLSIAVESGMPVRRPTFELGPDHKFAGWNSLGDAFSAHIEDRRYPGGTDITSRMVGWELTPASGTAPEVLRLVVEGADA